MSGRIFILDFAIVGSMTTMMPSGIGEFGTEGEKSFYPGSRTPRPLAGMSPRLDVSQVSRPLPAGLHKFLEGVAKPDAHYLCWYTPDINGWVIG